MPNAKARLAIQWNQSSPTLRHATLELRLDGAGQLTLLIDGEGLRLKYGRGAKGQPTQKDMRMPSMCSYCNTEMAKLNESSLPLKPDSTGEKKKQSPNLVDMEADRGSWRTLLRRSIGAVFNFRRCLFELRLDEARGPTLLLQLCGIVIKVRRETQEQTARSDMQRTPRPDWHIQWITAALNFVQRHFELRLDRAGQLTCS
ncbi:hypothetical protein WMY93_018459 [Mugilogobius chulae]|uniref:Uncharacterized protein n=1 Tax=Mugilogobius chulae TaxID=88201 RepID=A0AAW0NNY5_9GOBI